MVTAVIIYTVVHCNSTMYLVMMSANAVCFHLDDIQLALCGLSFPIVTLGLQVNNNINYSSVCISLYNQPKFVNTLTITVCIAIATNGGTPICYCNEQKG